MPQLTLKQRMSSNLPIDNLFSFERLFWSGRLRELSLPEQGHPHYPFTDLRKERNGEVLTKLYSEGGITEFVEMLIKSAGRTPLTPNVLSVDGHDENTNVAVEVARLLYNDLRSVSIFTPININTN